MTCRPGSKRKTGERGRKTEEGKGGEGKETEEGAGERSSQQRPEQVYLIRDILQD